MSRDDDFLSRWSRRKRAVAEVEVEVPTPEPVEPGPEALPDETEAETLARLNLPDPDTLGAGDDFSAFMARAVPEALRRRALRRLWVSNPTLACVDGLNDYDGDFTGGGVATGTLKTAYQVGRGILRQIDEIAPPAADANAPAPEPDPAPPVEVAEAPMETSEAMPGSAVETGADAAPRRRMRFRFEGEDGGLS